MSYPLTQIGGGAFNHQTSSSTEAEYDRLRDLARQEASRRSSCLDKAHAAYSRGDGAAAHQLSEEGKRHAAKMDEYNKQAADYIFRENNAVGRVDADTIDLHGLFVEEAEEVVEGRIRYAQSTGQTHLHIIVGKGNHSRDHIQKLKPRVEQVCQEMGLQYATEENIGRIYVNLQGGPAIMPPHLTSSYNSPSSHQHHGGGGHGGGGGGKYHSGQQQSQGQFSSQQHRPPPPGHGQGGIPAYGGGGGSSSLGYQAEAHAGPDPEAELKADVKRLLPRVLRKLGCCVVM